MIGAWDGQIITTALALQTLDCKRGLPTWGCGIGDTRDKEEHQCLPSPLPCWLLGTPRTHGHSHLQVLEVADGGVVHGAHSHSSGVCEVAKGWGAGKSLPAHVSRRACVGGGEGALGVSSGLDIGDGVLSVLPSRKWLMGSSYLSWSENWSGSSSSSCLSCLSVPLG